MGACPHISSGNLEAGQVQEAGTVRVSRSRAQLGSILSDEEGRRDESNIISHSRKASRRAKGRKGSAGLLKKQIMNIYCRK